MKVPPMIVELAGAETLAWDIPPTVRHVHCGDSQSAQVYTETASTRLFTVWYILVLFFFGLP